MRARVCRRTARAGAVLLAFALTVAALPPLQRTDAVQDDERVRRLAGAERTATSARISRTVAPDGADAVAIASAADFPDALTAAPLAHSLGAPVLLAFEDGLTDPVRDEVERLGPQRAVVLGGESALGTAVEEELRRLGVDRIERVAGENRFDTAARIAARLHDQLDTVFLASGTAWPDALSVAPLVARQGSALLLAGGDRLPAATRETLERLDVDHAIVAGGTAVVGDVIEHELDQLGISVERLAGAERYETSQRAVEAGIWSNADGRRIWLATGRDWPDALTAASAVAHEGGVLQLVDGQASEVRGPAAELLRGWGSEATRVTLVGGGAVMPAGFEEQAAALLDRRPEAGDFQVTDLGVEGEGVRVELSPASGAERYEVRDIDGRVLHEGSEPAFSLDDDTGSATVVALADGEAVAQRDVRLTSFTAEGLADLRLGASFGGGEVVLDWRASDGPRRPRKVVRRRVQETPEGHRELVEPRTVAYTCRGVATDRARDKGEEYTYEVLHAPGGTAGFCSGDRQPHELRQAVALASVRVPADASTARFGTARARNTPLPTSIDRMLSSRATQRMAGEQQPTPLLVRYQTFIARENVPRPLRRGQWFEGDGRSFSPKGSHRTRIDVTTHFGDDPHLEVERSVSPSRLYEETENGLEFVEERQAGTEGMEVFRNFQERDRAMYTIQHDVGIPFDFFAGIDSPGIGYQVTFLLDEGASLVRGEHDFAPHHEVWFGPVPGEFWQSYGRENRSFWCLGPLPGCTARINKRL